MRMSYSGSRKPPLIWATWRDSGLLPGVESAAEEFGFDIAKEYPAIGAWMERMKALPGWAATPGTKRAQLMHEAARRMHEVVDEVAKLLSLEQGKPYAAEALPDVDETAENFRIAAEDVKRMETAVIPSRDPNKRILTFRKPNGVYAAITPWNFPTLIPVELIAPGIAAGNTIVMKPSEWTPRAMANFVQIMADAGLPDPLISRLSSGM